MVKVMYDRQFIKVEELESIETSWGYDYKLYKDAKGRYYVTESDGVENVIEFCRVDCMCGRITDDVAKEKFKEYMRDLEEEQEG